MHGVSSPVDEFDQLLCKQIEWLVSTFEWHKTSHKGKLGDLENQSVRSDKENEISCWQKSFTINMQSSFLFSHFDAWWIGDIGKWRNLEVCKDMFDAGRSLTRLPWIFSLRSFLLAHTRSATLSQAELGPNSSAALRTRHVFHNSPLLAMTRTQCLFSGLKWIKNYEAQNIRK